MADECTTIPDGVVLNKYYLDTCTACKRLEPEIKRVRDRLEEASIAVRYREIECTECACEDIKSFPTLVITRDQKEVGKTVGYKAFEGLGSWVAAQLKIDPLLFVDGTGAAAPAARERPGVVKELVTRDFLSGFDGQWLILFYEDPSDQNRKHLRALAGTHGDRLNIGEIRASEAKNVTNRFNITEYPHIVGINHGNAVPYAGERSSLSGLRRFAERLHEPNFVSVTYSALAKMGSALSAGEPVYVVLYKNYELASHYFNDLAQQFKFRARIYKSNDPAMFEAAGFHPKDYGDFAAEKRQRPAHSNSDVGGFDDANVDYNGVDHNQMVKLLVYKNHTFYPSNVPLDQGNDIVQWIFHTHFSHVTNISNENFYTIFHGIKPVMILLTSNEQFLEEFNKLSADKHLGTPYTTVLFATLDVGEYPLFKKQVLPLLKTPALAFYDPMRVRWFVTDRPLGKMSAAEFTREAAQMIDSYVANKLPSYPPRKSRMSYYMVGAWAVLIAAFFCFRSVAERYKID